MKRLSILLAVFLLSLNLFSQDVLVKSILEELNRIRNKHNLSNVVLSSEFDDRGKNHNDNMFVFCQPLLHREYSSNDTIECYETTKQRYDGKGGREVIQSYTLLKKMSPETLSNVFIMNFYNSKEGHKEDILTEDITKVMIAINKYKKYAKFSDGFVYEYDIYYLTIYLYK